MLAYSDHQESSLFPVGGQRDDGNGERHLSARFGVASEHGADLDPVIRRDRLDQFDVRYLWPVNENWRLFSRVNYSLEDSELLEALVGVEYDSCCWALRVSARRYLRDRNGGERDALYVQLRLKGLGAFGRREPTLFHTPAP